MICQTAKEWSKIGLSPKEATDWKNAGFSPQNAGEWKNAGWTLEGVKAREQFYQKSCPNGVEDLLRLWEANPYDVKGRCFHIFGSPMQILTRTTALFNVYDAAYFLDFG